MGFAVAVWTAVLEGVDSTVETALRVNINVRGVGWT